MEFHYPNFQNDMWRVYLVFFDDKEHFRKGGGKKPLMRIRSKRSYLEAGIASCPTVFESYARKRAMHRMHSLRSLNLYRLQRYWTEFHTVNILVTTGGKGPQKFC